MAHRWELRDPATSETWTFPLNPNRMTSPHAPRSLTIMATAPSQAAQTMQGRVIENNQDPYEWTFSGRIRTQEHHDELYRWSRKVGRLELTDHFDRVWSIRMIQFIPDEKRPSQRAPWRFEYDVKTLNYGLVT